MTTWGDLMSRIRTSLLKDTNVGKFKYADEDLRVFCGMALDELCSHTAKEVEVVYTNETVKTESPLTFYDLSADLQYTLPIRPYDDFSTTSAVIAITGTKAEYYPRNPHRIVGEDGYYAYPETKLHLHTAPCADKLIVRYYGYWSHPEDPNSTLDIPKWAEAVISYRVAIHTLTALGIQTADIRQWENKGNIELNPLRSQQEWMLKMYNEMLNRQPRQQRGLIYGFDE